MKSERQIIDEIFEEYEEEIKESVDADFYLQVSKLLLRAIRKARENLKAS